MSKRCSVLCLFVRRWAFLPATCLLAFTIASPGSAQVIQQAIGGVRIDAAGIVQKQSLDEQHRLRSLRQQSLDQIPSGLNAFTEHRMISLRRLESLLEKQQGDHSQLPDEVRYLAGLQQIKFIFVYPESGDIVIGGPAEGWKVNHEGSVVGLTTNMPVLQLDDLLVALRTADETAETGITCSIEPTNEGILQFNKYIRENPAFTSATVRDTEQVLGLQQVLVRGVPKTTRFANVLVAADYRMKRLAMGLDESPVAGLPSFMDLTRRARLSNMMPRWWMEAEYEPILRDEEGLSWELRGARVKTLTEEDILVDGKREKSGKSHTLAQRWADLFTEKYDEISSHHAVFRELRNCMDLAVAAALIVRERLDQKAGVSMAVLRDPARLPTDEYAVPQAVNTVAAARQKRGGWEISASGGVDIDPWGIAGRQDVSPARPAQYGASRDGAGGRWWWN